MERKWVEEVMSWQGLCRYINNDRLFPSPYSCSLNKFSFKIQGTGHRGHLAHLELSPSDKIIQGCLSKMWQLIPVNNTWWKCIPVYACFCNVHMYWGRCECLCVGHKRKVNTVHASPVITPALASSHASHLAACWLCFVRFSQKETLSFLKFKIES